MYSICWKCHNRKQVLNIVTGSIIIAQDPCNGYEYDSSIINTIIIK